MVVKDENQGREPAIQEVACVATVLEREPTNRTRPETLPMQVSLFLIKF